MKRFDKIGVYKSGILDDYLGERKVERKDRKKVIYICRYHTGLEFDILTDITCVDYPNNQKRFIVVYNRLSIRYAQRRLVKVDLSEEDILPSIMDLYKSANWMEREVWDMFGIMIYGHKDLRRILTDYGFEGFPLRKDFPLTGYLEARYDEETKGVKRDKVELSQVIKK